MYSITQSSLRLQHLLRDDEGAQVVEYALIIAVVSIALVLAIQGLAGGKLADFVARVTSCLTGTCT
ncbi:MAG: Flp family type IVb pilin [Comamonas testosteroni]|uniref:Flp family type IVb pilin n=1 Tax=Comamonas testosteroni TaxID=285 RepID=UPI003D0A76AE